MQNWQTPVRLFSIILLTACSAGDEETCGNGVLDASEQCDGDLFQDGLSCTSLGYPGGTLGCQDTCHFTVVTCVSTAASGSACNCSSDCEGTDANPGICVSGVCMTSAGSTCAEAGTAQGCPEGSRCWGLEGADAGICWPDCDAFTCAGECDADGSCVPNGNTSCDGTCSDYCGGGGSSSTSGPCSPENPNGDCPSGQVCVNGACEVFNCNDTILEPNESQTAAADLPTSTTNGMQICSGDKDWFKLTPTATNKLYMVGVDSNPTSGNLILSMHDVLGDTRTSTQVAADFYHPENATGPMNIEMQGIIGASGAPTQWFQVSGSGGAVNNYNLISRQVDWQDGSSCTDYFSSSDCAALTSGYHDSSKMLQFPVGHAADTYIGDGVYFDNALSMSNFGPPVQTPSSRNWARRELIMAVRYAINTVQTAFPGTAPLGMGDISMPDGTTPDGHPNGTHYSGANIDIAYYIRPEFHGLHGNLAYRHVCCEASLSDWGCVDTNTSSSNYGTCVAGSEDTHIADIPRNALFMAKLASTGRIRVIGVEAKIDALLDAEFDNLVEQGLITSLERSKVKNVIVTANDHGSWIWHFNHMHVSFQSDLSKDMPEGIPGPNPEMSADEQLGMIQHYYRHSPSVRPFHRPSTSGVRSAQPGVHAHGLD